MPESTTELWQRQDRLVGDREGLYRAVASHVTADRVLYPGSYVDIAPSFVFDNVRYADMDKRANRFFGDTAGVDAIIEARTPGRHPTWSFEYGDYSGGLDLPGDSVDLLISLYAGFISEHCTHHLRVGGTLLVNSSHGDAAMASIDDRYELAGVVTHREGAHAVSTTALDRYLVPKRPTEITVESLHESGRGVAYTMSPFAYLFRRTR